jgi:hypothetical protein
LKCYRVEDPSELGRVAAWIAAEQQLQNQSLTLCWSARHKTTTDYVTGMLQNRLSSIAVAEDDSGNIKAVIYFEFRDEQHKVTEKWMTYGSVVVDSNDWANGDMGTFNALLRFVYEYCYSQGVFKGELWVLEKIFKSHQDVLGSEFLTVLDERNVQPSGNLKRFHIDIKGAMEAQK